MYLYNTWTWVDTRFTEQKIYFFGANIAQNPAIFARNYVKNGTSLQEKMYVKSPTRNSKFCEKCENKVKESEIFYLVLKPKYIAVIAFSFFFHLFSIAE